MAELNYIFSFVLKCKPDVFLSVARAYAQENKIECAYPSFGLPERVSNNSNDLLSWQNRFDPNHTCIRMYVSEQDAMTKKRVLHRCEIVALLRSDGITSDLRVRMVEGEWKGEIKTLANGLLDHLKEKGWIATAAPVGAQTKEQPGPKIKMPADRAKSISSREPREDDRIRTTLMTWAVQTGKHQSYAQAATCLGTIHVDTRRNHENGGWLYSDEEMEAKGGFEYLWTLYTTESRKL